MSDPRGEMNKAIRDVVIPALRARGFKGSFPHFYREIEGHIDLLSFQFHRSGGSFVVELSFATPERGNVYIDQDDPPKKLRVGQTTRRLRLGASSENKDHWFSFEESDFLLFFRRQPNVRRIAEQVARLLRSQAETWWRLQRQSR
jgi:uncharacterized protein DUF4304